MKIVAALFALLGVSQASISPELIKKAVKVNRRTLRRVEENNQQITAAHSLQFQQCTSLTMGSPNDEIMFGDDYIQYTQNGKIVAEKSYILFSVCETEDCYYADDEEVYMVDLATYMGSVINYIPDQRQNYCNACLEAQDYCANGGNQEDEAAEDEAQEENGEDEQGDEDNNEQDQEENDEGDQQDGEEQEGDEGQEEGGERRLRKLQNNNGNFEVVDCYTCAARNCFEDEGDGNNNNNGNDEYEVNDENIAAWVENLLACAQTEQVWGDANLYTGFICNSDGSGVEIGVFLDEDCSIYTSNYNYKNVMDQNELGLMYNSQEIVTYPFLNDIDCAEAVEYITPEEYEEMQANGEDQNQNGEQDNNANEYCQGVFENNALSINDCDGDGQEDEEEDNVEEEEEQGYDWYTYLISAEDAEDDAAVCKVLQTLEGEYGVVYDSNEEEGSGSIYTYNTGSTGFWGGNDNSAGLIAAIVIGIIVALAACFFALRSSASKQSGKKERLLHHNYDGKPIS